MGEYLADEIQSSNDGYIYKLNTHTTCMLTYI